MPKGTKQNRTIGSASTHGDPKYPYSLTPNSLRRFLGMIPNKPRPPKITGETLKVWGFKNTNDASVLRVLKKLDLLSSAGEPTNYYAEFMKMDTGPAALGYRVRVVYAALFNNVANPEKATNEDLKNFFNIHSGGADETIRLQIETFKALAAYATFGESDPLTPESPPVTGDSTSGGIGAQGPAVRIDLHIHLPENKTKSDYDAILESIAHHLYQRKRE